MSVSVCPHCGKSSKLIPIGKTSGFSKTVQLQSTAQSLDYTEPVEISEHRSFWASDGITYTIAGLFSGAVVLSYSWYYDLSAGWAVAVAALGSGIGLHVLKVWLHRPPSLPKPPKPDKVTIEIEQWSEDNKHVILNQFTDNTITLDELRRVGRAITTGHNFSRPSLTFNARISQGKYNRIKKEFEQLDFCYTDAGNRTILLRSGKAFLRQVASLPR